MFKKEEIILTFGFKPSGNKGWYSGDCRFCGKKKHFGVIFGNISSFICFSCGRKGTLFSMLKEIGRLDLCTFEARQVENLNILSKNSLIKEDIFEEKIDFDHDSVYYPVCFERIFENEYLERRGFIREHYVTYTIGESKIEPKFREGYLIFCILEGKELKGYVGRSIHSKLWIKNYEETTGKYHLRWINNTSDFSKLVFGYNQLTENTEICILVEGVTSKANVDKLLNLFVDDKICCICTFGKKVSKEQILKILSCSPKLKKIILLYDGDAYKELKKYAFY